MISQSDRGWLSPPPFSGVSLYVLDMHTYMQWIDWTEEFFQWFVSLELGRETVGLFGALCRRPVDFGAAIPNPYFVLHTDHVGPAELVYFVHLNILYI